MKKMYLVKGMAALAMGLVAVSCNKASFDEGAYQNAKEQESQEQFVNNVMGGQQIDPNQNWKTTNTIELTVTTGKEGTLKIYPANPIGNTTGSLYTINVTAGQTVTFNVTKGVDLTKLYAAVVDEKNNILDMLAIDAAAEKAEVNMGMPETRSAVNLRRAMPAQPTFSGKPSMPTIYKNTLAEAKEAGAVDGINGVSNNGTFYLEGSAYAAKNNIWALDVQNTPLTMYFDGNVHFGGNNYQNGNTAFCVTSGSTLKLATIRNGLVVYLAPNATLDLTDIEWAKLQNSNSAIYMNAGSKIKARKLMFYNGVEILNAGGTISCSEYLELDNGVLLYNEGTVECTSTTSGDNYGIRIKNTNAELVNCGTLTSNSTLILSGGGKFFNDENGTTTVAGLTEIQNESDCWMNSGLYTSGTFKCVDTQKVYNNCRLTVTGKFTMSGSDSNFILNGDASLICDSFDWNSDNAFWLGGGSLVKVANTLKSNNANDGDRGFFHISGDYAVISAKSVTTDYPNSQWRARYKGKIYVAADSHFDFVSLNDTQKNIYYDSDVVFVNGGKDNAPVNWNESKCKPAYHGGVVPPEPTIYYYYAFEDLGAIGDFDFNDVVLRLSAPESNQSTVQVMAAGGTLPVQVTYGGTNLGGEVHGEFDVQTGVMINTGQGPNLDPIELGVVNIAANADMANLPFGIVVSGAGSIKVTNEVDHTGEAPLMIVVSGYPSGDDAGKWFWPREYMNISKAYTQFGAWGADVQSNTDWYHHYTEGNVWKY